MKLAPVNPADINMIAGTYPIRPQLLTVCGGKGYGVVRIVGSQVTRFAPGDWVVPARNMPSTWTTLFKADEDQLLKIPKGIHPALAATIKINPVTAYLMLTEVDPALLNYGDWVVQNGANSACGQALIQIAAKLGYRTLNIIRDRTHVDEVKSGLMELGATMVMTEEEMRGQKSFDFKPKLALNCVGGQSSNDLMRLLDSKGVHVTYSGMSSRPVVSASTSALIFKNVRVEGFWLSRWIDTNFQSQKMVNMYEFLGDMAKNGELIPPMHKIVPMRSYKKALSKSAESRRREGKIIFNLEDYKKK